MPVVKKSSILFYKKFTRRNQGREVGKPWWSFSMPSMPNPTIRKISSLYSLTETKKCGDASS